MATLSALASAACLLLSNLGAASAQAAAQIGGRPPTQVEYQLCSIADVFGKMGQITTDADCLSGCAGGTGACPVQWYPSSQDECSPACGRIFEPFVSCCHVQPPRSSASSCFAWIDPSALPSRYRSGTSAERCSRRRTWVAWMRWEYFTITVRLARTHGRTHICTHTRTHARA